MSDRTSLIDNMPGSPNYSDRLSVNGTGTLGTSATSVLTVQNSSADTVFEINDDGGWFGQAFITAPIVIHNPMSTFDSMGTLPSTRTLDSPTTYVAGMRGPFGNSPFFPQHLLDIQMRHLIKKQAKIIRPLSLR